MPHAQPHLLPRHFASALARGEPVELHAPSGGSGRLVDANLTDLTVAWQGRFDHEADDPLHGATVVGIGAACRVQSRGSDRFAQAQRAIMDAFDRLQPTRCPFSEDLRFFGGASFASGEQRTGSWAAFGEVSFVLPRLLYIDTGESARLIVVPALDESATAEEPVSLTLEVLRLLQTSEPPSVESALEARSRKDSCDPTTWRQLVSKAQSDIQAGTYEKVVAARRMTLELTGTPRVSTVLRRLEAQAPRCVRFCLRVGAQTFLGATPERLIERSGLKIRTEALAGTIERQASGQSPGVDPVTRLLESDKDQREHEFVVRAIRQALEPLCSAFQAGSQPSVLTLEHLHHLRTPISGQLKGANHVLELVSRLHPTPAVGGLPRGPAEAFIRRQESTARGWYASPFGWIDHRGDGQFVVALRTALLHEERVHVFAGAGIVKDSDADLEYRETELKMRGMLGALGVSWAPAATIQTSPAGVSPPPS